ncbi:MAG: hypothetical protein V3V28_09320 [Polaribacter sp.]|uniref:hypothetical protein n=1 Tax=Polaribacter sp. TaxID=1920175 RepID=UPI002307B7F1|nr:hypothetical protein [Tenacibaculum maritimum]MDB0602352.1 hypothetical protein [Tenacibaculum maritimum]MDB0613487.1 hypothetical protein [Tenacibaculum maritimum]
MQEELTDKMHSEFTIDSETEISHKVHAACSVVKDGVFELNEALEVYDITKAQYDKYSPKWLKLIS